MLWFKSALALSIGCKRRMYFPALQELKSNRFFTRRFAVVAGSPPPVTSHLSLVHSFLVASLEPGDVAVDATAGNGHDALTLARILLPNSESGICLLCIDIQRSALNATKVIQIMSFKIHTIPLSSGKAAWLFRSG
jgi:hypothetical protein